MQATRSGIRILMMSVQNVQAQRIRSSFYVQTRVNRTVDDVFKVISSESFYSRFEHKIHQGDEQMPSHIRIELTSENDLFFHYTHSVDEQGFRQMQETQKLMIDFPDYCSVVIKMLNNCIKEPHRYATGIACFVDSASVPPLFMGMEQTSNPSMYVLFVET